MNVIAQREKALEDYLSRPCAGMSYISQGEYLLREGNLQTFKGAFRTGWDAHENHRWEEGFKYMSGGREA